MKQLGWMKGGVIAPYASAETVHALLQLAESSTVYEIEAQTRDMPTVGNARCVILRMHPETIQSSKS